MENVNIKICFYRSEHAFACNEREVSSFNITVPLATVKKELKTAKGCTITTEEPSFDAMFDAVEAHVEKHPELAGKFWYGWKK